MVKENVNICFVNKQPSSVSTEYPTFQPSEWRENEQSERDKMLCKYEIILDQIEYDFLLSSLYIQYTSMIFKYFCSLFPQPRSHAMRRLHDCQIFTHFIYH